MQTLEVSPQINQTPLPEQAKPQTEPAVARGDHLQGDITVASNPRWDDESSEPVVDIIRGTQSGQIIREQLAVEEAHALKQAIHKTPMLSR